MASSARVEEGEDVEGNDGVRVWLLGVKVGLPKVRLAGEVGRGCRGACVYHGHAILCHVLEHLVENLVDYVVIGPSNRESDGGSIQIWGQFARRTKHRVLCTI